MKIRSIALAAAVLMAPLAQAGAPQVQTQAPGYYRMMLGDFEVTALSDGTVGLHVEKLLQGTTPKKVESALAKWRLGLPLETSVNGYLVNTGSKLVLIDAGAGGLFGPTLGNLVANLKASGYTPEQVDEIYITHMHPDHVGGLAADGKIVFPNAVVRADQADADFWLSAANLEAAPKESKGFFQGAQASLKPYVDAGRFKAISADEELAPGIKAVATHGHTKGHRNYVVQSKGQKLVLWGDLMHVAAVQFATPAVTIAFDTDQKAALAQRRKAFAEAAKQGYFIGASHLSFPGIGHLSAQGAGYSFQPTNYTTSLKK
ncbi:MBL fold metallo-hydrolase [Rhizobacter sp. AJA081-3]|uniref:MBL fold metallo-hydrolase n=1 Tax=Rhizobacter sp. AJA081-3 TaxID=2753607 RepID=UPI001ADEEAFD|nr:MBL fold metallo-hydrolase [Rhizobacter sp. AJA081-3]QTN22749.1 MBL fold metallo-hydrolase [Rhizobacter sp. AJA081-3]